MSVPRPSAAAAAGAAVAGAAGSHDELHQGLLVYATALAAGALLTCAFAPLNLWPLAILCPALLMWLWEGSSARRAAWSGFWFGAGTFALGTWWLYISIHDVAQAPAWLALALVLALVAIMAAYHALLGWLSVRALPASGPWRWLVGLPSIWLLIEWWRGWFISGFPWLSLGYSQTDTAVAGFAPVIGVYGLSGLLLVGAGALLALLRGSRAVRILAAVLLLLPWPLGAALGRVDWTRASAPPISVAILQGAVPEDLKWQADNVEPTRELYTQLNQQALGARLIIWPEAALPQLANEIAHYLGQQYSVARQHGSDLVMGILRVDENDKYYNSILTLSDKVSFYDKHHLVPFAEYFPVPGFIRSWLEFMNLPYSDFTPGAARQPTVAAGGTRLALGICYEDAYGSAQLAVLRQATLLVNVTNNAWYGDSTAPHQHLQIARMRALEAGRYLVRAANDGITAVIGPRGQIVARLPQFQEAVLRADVQPMAGLTPYARTGNYPVIGGAALLLAVAIGRRRRS
ncbi:MAG: apolipoprotein N-acyltransferase [Steroidobacterales bacterium]